MTHEFLYCISALKIITAFLPAQLNVGRALYQHGYQVDGVYSFVEGDHDREFDQIIIFSIDPQIIYSKNIII
jgi:hypothetical protein